MHRGTVHDRFGWHRNGYLGRLAQVSTWTASGHGFFAQHRLLRYLREPAVGPVLTAAPMRRISGSPVVARWRGCLRPRKPVWPRAL